MPDTITMILLGVFFLLFAIFALFVWREKASDEREGLNRMRAGRIAYLVMSGIVTLGIGTQTFTHHVDPWLVATLAAAVLAKAAASYWSKNHF